MTSDEYNQEHLFGSDKFIDKLKNQASNFITEAKKKSEFINARFARVDVYKYDCEARFYWGIGEESKYVILILGNNPAIKLQRNGNLKYDDKDIDQLREISEKLGWGITDGES